VFYLPASHVFLHTGQAGQTHGPLLVPSLSGWLDSQGCLSAQAGPLRII
jgi:hypothetical protein